MSTILESIFKGFAQWLYGLGLEIVQYIANSLLDVFTMDLEYFRRVAPVTDEIISIIIAAGWALLLGNLVFQATKSMMTGLGFEGEDPKLLFTRTFVFGFLLLASRQVCDIGLGISSSVIQLLQIPNSVTISLPDENNFNIGASWLLVIIVNFVIMWQLVKLFFEIAERYVVTAVLVMLSPLAFATGGSKNTADIFKGWCRMFGSMCLMMVLNVVFLKLLIAAMGHMPSDVGVLPWMLLIVGIARVARKADSIVARMGLNPAITGDGLGRGLPGMMAYAVVKSVGSTVAKTVAHSAGKGGSGSSAGARRSSGPAAGGRSTPPPTPPPAPPSGSSGGGTGSPTSGRTGQGQNNTNTGNGAGRTAAAYAQQSAGGTSNTAANPGQYGQQTASGQTPPQQPVPGSGAQAQRTAPQGTRRTSVPPGTKTAWQNTPHPSASSAPPSQTAQTAGTAEATGSAAAQSQQEAPQRPPIPRVQNGTQPSGPSPSGGGQPKSGASRRTSAVHTTSTAATGVSSTTHSSTETNTQQQSQTSKPIRQDGTPKISPPPGVSASGKGERSHPASAGTRRTSVPNQPPISGGSSPTGTAGTRKTSVSSQPPVSGGAPPTGTAGTRKTSVPSQPPVSSGTPPTGTAGTRKTSVPGQPPVSGGASPTGSAGTRKTSAPSQPPVSGGAPPTGTAGTRKTSVPGQPPASGGTSPTGTAGTRKTSVPGQPPVSGGTPPTGTAGTHKTSIPSQPPVSGGASPTGTAGTHKTSVPTQPPIGGRAAPSGLAETEPPKPGKSNGTKRIKPNPAQAPMNGGSRANKNTRRKKGGPGNG